MTEQREKSNANYHVVLFGPALKETVSSVFEIAGIEHLLLCAENDNQFRELVKTHSPKLILLNFDAKEIRLFDLVDWLKKQTPGATVIGITKKG